MVEIRGLHKPSPKPPGQPVWFYKGIMELGKPNTFLTPAADLYFTSVGSLIAEVLIRQVSTRPKYVLGWRVMHEGGFDNPQTNGRIELNPTELMQMFCLSDVMLDELSLWLIGQYGGTVASQGKFLRWGKYLNIPGPGTGHEGDANISVFVSDEICSAVRSMLEQKGHLKAA